MKAFIAFFGIALAIHAPFASAADLSPISRVVELLKDLQEKVENDGKAEETLFKKFICWAESNVAAKTASNAAAGSRIESLKQYIADIDAGRIEFTSERTDLEKELAEMNADLESAADLRAKEKADFEDAEAEMNKAIAALENAIRVLKEATGGSSSAMLAMKSEIASGYAARAAEAATLVYAADLGDRFLSKGDAIFLRRVLTGDIPKADWNKLNRKATFKTTYQARSGNIQKTLAKLLATFRSNLADASSKEAEAKDLYDKLAETKGLQKTAAENALLKLEAETGDRGLNKADAQAEVDALEAQVEDDTEYIAQVNNALDTKQAEWKTRSELRSKELAAISEAISILHSDDARDLFKKSLASQGFSLLQTVSSVGAQIRPKAVAEIQRLTKTTGDMRLQALARTATRGNFDAVIAAIDGMLKTLQHEETAELTSKEQCEKDRDDDTRAAAVASRTIDELTDEMTKLAGEIKELQATIDESNKEIASIEEQLAEAKRLREDQAREHAAARADDVAAVALVEKASEVLSGFYADNGLMLIEHKQAPVSAAGQAPPPPPTTWENPYAGATGESTGILATLKMIADDMKADIQKADDSEAASIKEYNGMKKKQLEAIGDLNTLVGELKGTIATKEGNIGTAQSSKETQKSGLDALFTKIKTAEPGCDFLLVNFQVKSTNRQIEMDGLLKAKAILQGAEFSTVDANRELKPGDALVQQRKGLRGVAIRRA